ncbi:MAG: DUF1385 domain-containing protein [Thermogemmatispora sp.]|uniref:DUF1385 domain-containing protein n=1 Tax=Thermogemmatispora sp. TaxID=1968838 RepID=UPI0019FBED48|nr:DUF1385 domain-containing protein [Thermogemmatispora sp.]MBE3565813.1 DUF1385 domain-containing protein [Thermogemmatispora sp.]
MEVAKVGSLHKVVRPSYGGQAVIEGVMIRGRELVVTAVRRGEDEVALRTKRFVPWASRWPILKRPFLRGVVALVESLIIGLDALAFSASQFAEEEEVSFSARDLVLTLALAFGLTVLLFIVFPALVARMLSPYIASNLFLNLAEGAVKVAVFVLYILAITLFPDIRRVFQYHGAEHKTLNAYEAGEPLQVERVRPYKTVHPRCGTNFILLVLLVSVFLFSFFGRPPFLERVLLHLAILPLVAGVSYEILKLAGKEDAPPFLRYLALPGLWLQYLTTREPDDGQIEVAIRSLSEVLKEEEKNVAG